MFRNSINFLIVFLFLSTACFAAHGDAILQAEYGTDLTKAPFFLRFSFSQEYNKDWEKSTFAERKAFLRNYDAGITAQKAQDKADTKAAALAARQQMMADRAEQRNERAKAKADADEIKAEAKAEILRQKEFNAGIKQEDKTLEQMEREATRGGGQGAEGLTPAPSSTQMPSQTTSTSQDSY